MLVATASWLRRTVPLIMAWTTLFLFLRLLASALVDGLHLNPVAAVDLWNDTYVVGGACWRRCGLILDWASRLPWSWRRARHVWPA